MSERTKAEEKPPSVLLGPPAKGDAPDSTADEFLDRHRRRQFVMDFARSKEFLMRNSRCMTQRVLEAAKLCAWLSKRDYVGDEKGRPMSITQFADFVGMDERRAGETIRELDGDCLLRVSGRVIFVVDDPDLERQIRKRRIKSEAFPTPGRGKFNLSPEEKAKVLTFWQSHDPNRFQEYQIADQEVRKKAAELQEKTAEREKLFAEAVQAYQEREAQTENIPHPGSGDENAHPGSGNAAEESPSGSGNFTNPDRGEEPSILNGFKALKKLASYDAEPGNTLADGIRRAISASGLWIPDRAKPGEALPLDARTVANVAKVFAELAPDQIEVALPALEIELREAATRRHNRPQKWGFVVGVATDIVHSGRLTRAAQEPRPEPTAAPAIDVARRSELEQRLAEDGTPEWEKDAIRKVLFAGGGQ